MIRPRNLRNLDRKARKRGESTTGLSKRKRVIACLEFFLGVAEFENNGWCFLVRATGEIAPAENFRLVLTNFFYLSNIRPVSWGAQWNGRDLAMYRCHALQIRRANDASTGRAIPVCSNE
jgi:hypothetical protein